MDRGTKKGFTITMVLTLLLTLFFSQAISLKQQTEPEEIRTPEGVEKEIKALDEEISKKKEDLLSVGKMILSELVLIGLPLCDFIVSDRVPSWRLVVDIGAMLFGAFIFTEDRIKREEIADLEEKKQVLTAELAGLIFPKPEVKEEDLKKRLPSLELVAFSRTYLPWDYRAGRYSDAVILNLALRNNTSKIIKTWWGFLVVKDQAGEVLFEAKVKDDKANIEPGGMVRASFRWENDPLREDEPFDVLVSHRVIGLELEKVEVVGK